MKNPNTQRFWDNKIKLQDKVILKSPIYNHKIRLVSSLIKKESSKILDIGVGYGHIEKILNSSGKNISLYGIDISEVSIKKMKSLYGNKFIVGSAENIPFNDNFFDYIVALDVLEHVDRKKIIQVLNQIKRVAKSGATILISVPINESQSDYKNNGHLMRYTLSNLTKELSSVGISVDKHYNLYAFKNFYILKSLLVRFVNFNGIKPNLLILICKK